MRRTIALALMLTAGLPLAGCTAAGPTPSVATTEQVAPGDIPDTQAFVAVAGPAGRWQVSVPEGWSERAVPGGFTYTDKFNSVRVVEQTASTPPTVASVRAAELRRLSTDTPGFTLMDVTAVHRKVGDGVLIRFEFDSAADAVTGRVHRAAGEQYLFQRSGHEVALTLAGAVGADNVDPWRTISDSFQWTS